MSVSLQVLTWGSGESVQKVCFHWDLGGPIFFTVCFNTCIQISSSAGLVHVDINKTSTEHCYLNCTRSCAGDTRTNLDKEEFGLPH